MVESKMDGQITLSAFVKNKPTNNKKRSWHTYKYSNLIFAIVFSEIRTHFVWFQ